MTLNTVFPVPDTRHNYAIDLSACLRLRTLTLGAPLAEDGEFVTTYVVTTLKSLPASVRSVCIAFDTFRPRETIGYTSATKWSNVWRALAKPTNIQAVQLRFSDAEVTARMEYGLVPMATEDFISDFAQVALAELTKNGYQGCMWAHMSLTTFHILTGSRF